jgi:hypothetical protein
MWLRGLCAGLSWFRLLCFPDDGRLLPKHVGASMQNKGLVQSVNIVGHFYYLLFNSFKAREGIPVVTVNDFSANVSHFFLELVSIRYFQF